MYGILISSASMPFYSQIENHIGGIEGNKVINLSCNSGILDTEKENEILMCIRKGGC